MISNLIEKLVQKANLTFDGDDLSIAATGKIIFDGDSGTHTYITESSADILRFVVGDVTMLELTEGAIADTVMVKNSNLSIPEAKL